MPAALPDGKIAAGTANGVAISDDKGATWKTVAKPMPSSVGNLTYGGLIYDSVRGAFFVFYWDCGSVVTPNGIWRYDTLIATGTGVAVPHHHTRLFAGAATGSLYGNSVFNINGRITRSDVAGTEGIYLIGGSKGVVKRVHLRAAP
jgi:hypothetical protein